MCVDSAGILCTVLCVSKRHLGANVGLGTTPAAKNVQPNQIAEFKCEGVALFS